MKKASLSLLKQSRLLCVSALIALGGYAAQAQAVSLSWSGPASGSVTVGQTFNVTLKFDGLSGTAGDSVYGYDFNINYDTSAFQFAGGAFGASGFNALDLNDPGRFFDFEGSMTDTAGVINIGAISGDGPDYLDTHQPDSFIGFTLSFVALAANPAALIEFDLFAPSLLLMSTAGDDMSFTMTNPGLSLSVNSAPIPGTVPEPGMLMLLGLGLLGFRASFTRKKKHNINN